MVAASVFPSPVFISAILPSCNTIPPITCTSKGRCPKVRLAASRTTAKASCKMSSSVSPSASLSRNSSVFARSSSSESFSISGSRADTATTLFWSALTFRPSPIRKIFVNRLGKLRSSLGRPIRHAAYSTLLRLLGGLYQPVITVTAPVYHIYLACIGVGEDEEGMVEELHLKRGLFGAHRLHLELLGTHDAGFYILLFILYDRRGSSLHGDGVSLSLAMPAVELASPVAPDLPLEFVAHTVYGSVHVYRGLPGLQHRAVDEKGRLGDLGLGDRGVTLVYQLHLRPRDA